MMPTTKKTAADIMARKLITLTPDVDLFTAMEIFLKHRISGAPVVDERGRLVGVLSEKDCMKVLVGRVYFSCPGAKAADVMSRDVRTVEHDADVLDIAGVFLSTPFRRLPVVQGGVLVGQVSRRDVLRAVHEMAREPAGRSRSAGLVERRTRQGRMVREAWDQLRDLVGPASIRRFAA